MHPSFCVRPRNHRRTRSNFRPSILDLAFEPFRYSKMNVELCDTICNYCPGNAVEDKINCSTNFTPMMAAFKSVLQALFIDCTKYDYFFIQ